MKNEGLQIFNQMITLHITDRVMCSTYAYSSFNTRNPRERIKAAPGVANKSKKKKEEADALLLTTTSEYQICAIRVILMKSVKV